MTALLLPNVKKFLTKILSEPKVSKSLYSLVLAHSWFNLYAPELVPMFYYRDKTLVHMFYFLNQLSQSSLTLVIFIAYSYVYLNIHGLIFLMLQYNVLLNKWPLWISHTFTILSHCYESVTHSQYLAIVMNQSHIHNT